MSEETQKETGSQEQGGAKKEKKSFFESASETIEDTVKAAGEAASEMAGDIKDKTGGFSDSLREKLKKGTQELFDLSAKLINTLNEKANEYGEKYKDRVDMIRLKREQEDLFRELGKALFEKKQADNLSLEEALSQDELKSFTARIDEKARQIIEHGEHIEQKRK